MANTAIVVPNWNGKDVLGECINSLINQSRSAEIVVVDNGSKDGSIEFLMAKFPDITVLKEPVNLGFAGGVNVGISYAIDKKYKYVALFNNDAVADKDWLKNLVDTMEKDSASGIVTSKLLSADKTHIDSTGDLYTNWGLPYPRGRLEKVSDKYDQATEIFSASGGASLYRIKMLEEIGLFDEDFFAYYEDVDLSFRAQLAGWKVVYSPTALAYHKISATSNKIKGFSTYHAMKNLPWLMYKNVPERYIFRVAWRFWLAYYMFFLRAIIRGHAMPAIRGVLKSSSLMSKKTKERTRIQADKTVSDEYIWNMITHDLPPNAHALRKIRKLWWQITGRQA